MHFSLGTVEKTECVFDTFDSEVNIVPNIIILNDNNSAVTNVSKILFPPGNIIQYYMSWIKYYLNVKPK